MLQNSLQINLSYEHVLTQIAIANNYESEKGLPDPYYSAEQVLAYLCKIPDYEIDLKSFIGTSYTLKTLIELLVREGKRDVLEKLWPPISKIQYCEYNPKPVWHTYFWRSEEGSEIQSPYESPQSLGKLNKEASAKPSNLPKIIEKNKNFLMLFLLTFPHRVKSDLVKLIDHNFLSL